MIRCFELVQYVTNYPLNDQLFVPQAPKTPV